MVYIFRSLVKPAGAPWTNARFIARLYPEFKFGAFRWPGRDFWIFNGSVPGCGFLWCGFAWGRQERGEVVSDVDTESGYLFDSDAEGPG